MLSLLLTAVLRPRQQNPLPKQINEGGSAPERTPEIKPDRSDTLWKQRDGEIASWRRRTGSGRNPASGSTLQQTQPIREADTPGRCQRKPQWTRRLGGMTICIAWTITIVCRLKRSFIVCSTKHVLQLYFTSLYSPSRYK